MRVGTRGGYPSDSSEAPAVNRLEAFDLTVASLLLNFEQEGFIMTTETKVKLTNKVRRGFAHMISALSVAADNAEINFNTSADKKDFEQALAWLRQNSSSEVTPKIAQVGSDKNSDGV